MDKQNKLHKATFSFYGIRVRVDSDTPAPVRTAEHDYSYFLSSAEGENDLHIRCHFQKPDYAGLPVMISSSIRLDKIIFRKGNKTYLDYLGKAINICDRQNGTCDIYTQNDDIAHETVYTSILSGVSGLLDKKRIHRIHGLGLEYKNRGILLLLPTKGGKTTLAMRALQDRRNDIRLLSDDSPLIKSDGTLLPFPVRIGANYEDMPPGIDARFMLEFKRMAHRPKVTIDTRCFADKICDSEVKPGVILIGRRSSGNISSIEPASKTIARKHCKLNSVIGKGLYQGPEFVEEKRPSNFFIRGKIFSSRMHNNAMLVSKSKAFSFVIGRDISESYETLLRFLKEFFAAPSNKKENLYIVSKHR